MTSLKKMSICVAIAKNGVIGTNGTILWPRITFVKSGLCTPNIVYLVQFVCLSDGVNLKVVATSIAEIERPVYHDVRNSMPHPTGIPPNTNMHRALSTIPEVTKRKYHNFFQLPLKMSVFAGMIDVQSRKSPAIVRVTENLGKNRRFAFTTVHVTTTNREPNLATHAI